MKLEITTIGNSTIFSRGNKSLTQGEKDNILTLQYAISDKVKAAKKLPVENRKSECDEWVKRQVAEYSIYLDRIENIEESIRELARSYWTN